MSDRYDRGRDDRNRDERRERRQSDRYGDRDRDRDHRDSRESGRRRSRSPIQDHRGAQRGRGEDNSRGRGQRGDFDRGGSRYGARPSNTYSKSNLPPLPESAPFPEGTGASIPAFDFKVRSTIGQKILCWVNHHVIETLPVIEIYQYDLRFRVPNSSQLKGSSKVTANQMARVLLNSTFIDFLGENFVFDGVSLGWSPSELMPLGKTLSATISLGKRRDNKPNEVEISVRNSGGLDTKVLVDYIAGGKADLNPMGDAKIEPLMKWLNAVFCRDPVARMVTRPNTNAYFLRSPGTSMVLKSTGGVLEALRGIFQTVQIRFNRLTINVDTTTSPFWVPGKSLIDSVCALVGLPTLQGVESYFAQNPGRFFQACGKLLGMYFTVRHLGDEKFDQKNKFQSWSAHDAVSTVFEETIDATTTRSTSIVDYFSRKYNINLKYPSLPLAHARNGEFPLELCFSANGERYKDILQGPETADFIKFATAPASERRSQIEENKKLLAWHTKPLISAHGLSANPKMMQVKALILPAPQLIYGSNLTAKPRDGQWNLRGLRFLRPMTIRSWAFVCFSPQTDMIDSFNRELIQGFRSVGLNIPSQPPSLLIGNPHGDIKIIVGNAIIKATKDFGIKPDLIFFLLTGKSDEIYSALKYDLDIAEGIASQVMLSEKAMKPRGQAQYVANIAMKVNVKLGGTNCTIDEPLFKQSRWMLIGGDTSMASPSALRQDPPPPTTAALTGTWDKECTAYTSIASMQQTTESNNIVHAALMFEELLARYKERNAGLLPQHIIYYRDGASESEFAAILKDEGLALRGLCHNAGTKITIIVAIKRHHTRFFAEGQVATKLGNVPPGTVIENSPCRNDSFIITQRDLQGTKRPTRYATLVDENNLSPDDFNRLTYGLCSTYARATTSVAVAPPVYYADQICERARLHLRDRDDGTQQLETIHKNLNWNMYWL